MAFVMYQSIWLALSSVQWGIWPKMRPARWCIWLSCQNVCQRSEAKGYRNSLIQHVSRIHRSLLLSISDAFFCYCRFLWLYRGICLCCLWSEGYNPSIVACSDSSNFITLRGGRGTAIYGLYSYVLLWRVWFSSSLLKHRVYKSEHLGLE